MSGSYEKDLDLNLLRVFVVVADTGSVTAAASRLYLTQPAVSAALRRLTTAVGAPLFVRAGRGLALTARGQRLFATARPHLEALVLAARSPAVFDPATSERTLRLGLSDSNDAWLLAPLLRRLAAAAPRMRIIVLPVNFRSLGDALATAAVDLAVTVAGDLPADVRRRPLFTGSFVCLFDPRHARIGRALTLARYLAHQHVAVSYNGDLRGVVEDLLGVQRDVRVSVPTFHSVGDVVEGSALLATLPAIVARTIRALRPALRTTALPLEADAAPMEMFWRTAVDDDDAVRYVRELVAAIADEEVSSPSPRRGAPRRSRRPRPGARPAAARRRGRRGR